MYRASAVTPGRQIFNREVPTLENGAQQLLILLRMGGWAGTDESALAVLRAGEPLEFKGITYRVSEAP